MEIFECNFGEGLKLLSEDGEICLVLLRDDNKNNNSRIRLGIKTSNNIDVCVREKYQRMQADLQQKVEAYYHKQKKEIPITLISAKEKLSKKPKVLLVEDAEIIRKVNTTFLESLGCKVIAAKDGREAFDTLQNKFDLILLDIGLPDVSGVEICRFIRKNFINQTTPVIFLTAFGDTVKDKCLSAGCDDFAIKPLSMEKLQKLICKWLLHKNQQENEG
ncbi:MAG: response regulator [Gammaproteobacteria bacterium]|jgi:CheY-like chemotaxis protein